MHKFLAIALLVIPTSIWAQEQHTMTLKEAQEYASEHSYSARGAYFDAEVALRGVKETIAIGLPQINGSLDYNNYIDIPIQVAPADAFGFPDYLTQFLGEVSTETGVPINAPAGDPNAVTEFQFGAPQTMTAGVALSQLIFDGSYFVGLKAAKTYTKVMDGAVEMTQRDVKAMVAESYHTVLIASENVEILEESLTVLNKTRQDTKAMLEQGFLEEQDLDQLDLSIGDLNNRIAHASNQKRIALDMLKYQLGMPMSSTLSLSDTVDGLLTDGAVDMLGLGFNFQQSIDYEVLNTRVGLMDLNVKNERVKTLPTIGGFYNYQKNAQRESFDFFEGDKKWYPIQLWGVKLSVPIFTSLRGVHRVAKARVEAERARMDLEQATQGATLEYESAKNDYSLALATYQNQQQSLMLAERIFNKTQVKYTEGVASSFDLAQAQTQLLQAQGSFIGGMLSVLNAKSRLSKSLNQYQ